MKLIRILTLAALATATMAGCDRPNAQTASSASNTPVAGSTASGTVTPAAPPAAPAAAPESTPTPARDATATASAPATGANSQNVVTDTLISGKVKTAITADNAMKEADIAVKTENGVVTLTGSVKSPDQVTLASALAQRQEGVSRVENQVAVR